VVYKTPRLGWACGILCTKTVKDALLQSFHNQDGVEFWDKLAKQDLRLYAQCLTRLIPAEVNAKMNANVRHGLTDDFVVRLQEGRARVAALRNAEIDAMVGGGELTIATVNETLVRNQRRGVEPIPPGDYEVVRVTDTSVGIPKEDLEHIFEPFFTTKEVGAGTGLGLSMVYGMIKQTGGYLVVDSKPGEGTVFTIILPSHAAEVTAVRAPEYTDGPAAADTKGPGPFWSSRMKMRCVCSRPVRRVPKVTRCSRCALVKRR
jgi:hypothetical protein